MAHIADDLPEFLRSIAGLQNHMEEQFHGLSSYERGKLFAEFVQSLIPMSKFGYGLEFPVKQKESHDDGIDFVAENEAGEPVLYIQSKYRIRDKSGFDSIISKFQGFIENLLDAPLFSWGGIDLDNPTPTTRFQIVTMHDLARIRSSPLCQNGCNNFARKFRVECGAKKRKHQDVSIKWQESPN